MKPPIQTPPLKMTSTLKSHLILMLRQRERKGEVAGMKWRMSVLVENLRKTRISQKIGRLPRFPQELAPLPFPFPPDPALQHQRLCPMGSAHRPPPAPVVKSGEEAVSSHFRDSDMYAKRKRKSRSLDARPVSPEESTCPICLGEVIDDNFYVDLTALLLITFRSKIGA